MQVEPGQLWVDHTTRFVLILEEIEEAFFEKDELGTFKFMQRQFKCLSGKGIRHVVSGKLKARVE